MHFIHGLPSCQKEIHKPGSKLRNTKSFSFGVEFVLGGLAGVGIGLITNPADTVKTRLQLQGELAAPDSYTKTYRSTFDAARQIVRNEGILALQSGLVPVLGLQVIVNTMRLGSYYFAKKHGLTVNEDGGTNVFRTAALSGISGSLAFIIGSPLYAVRDALSTGTDSEQRYSLQALQ